MIYVASSWRNVYQPEVVKALIDRGLEVYDFRHPEPGDNGFSWAEIDKEWQRWTTDEYLVSLHHLKAEKGFAKDMSALIACSCCVLVLPCGRSAHLELGYACGAGKDTRVYFPARESFEPELMYKMVTSCHTNLYEMVHEIAISSPSAALARKEEG